MVAVIASDQKVLEGECRGGNSGCRQQEDLGNEGATWAVGGTGRCG